MGYDIYIGEAEIDDYPDGSPMLRVNRREEAAAPMFPGDDLTGRSNSRHPSYTGWSEFCRKTGLYDLFFDESVGLMRRHPGIERITPRVLATVRASLDAYQTTYPSAQPGWCRCQVCLPYAAVPDAAHVHLDGDLARLTWLAWWMDWAIRECRRPCCYNS